MFYVDENGQHGLIASKVDVNEEGIQWRNGAAGNKVTNARGDGIGAGETNTKFGLSSNLGKTANSKAIYCFVCDSCFAWYINLLRW